MNLTYDAVCFDLFGTLVSDAGDPAIGAREALAHLGDARWCIVTSCGAAFAKRLMASAGLPLPRVLISSDDTERTKPHGDPYVLAARTLGVAPERAIVVEDSVGGISAGRAAGMDVLALLLGRGLGFASEASFQVERFADVTWAVQPNGTIHLSF
jgi:beta-phosphoglucomutase-like phosphatase (HAD superfamily)